MAVLEFVLAGLLDAAESPEDFFEKPPVEGVRELLGLAPKVRGLLARLEAREGGDPSLFDLATLLYAVESPSKFPECWRTALWLVRSSAAGRALFAPLESTAQVIAGEEGALIGGLDQLLLFERQLDRLVEDDGWGDPWDLLDPLRQTGIEIAELQLLCESRLAEEQDSDHAARLRTVRDRLRHHQILEKGADALGSRMEAFEKWLREDDAVGVELEPLAWVTAAMEQLAGSGEVS